MSLRHVLVRVLPGPPSPLASAHQEGEVGEERRCRHFHEADFLHHPRKLVHAIGMGVRGRGKLAEQKEGGVVWARLIGVEREIMQDRRVGRPARVRSARTVCGS